MDEEVKNSVSESVASAIGGESTGTQMSMYFLRDIVGILSYFSGTNPPDVIQWLKEFEEMALILKWSSLQMFICARQLLVGSAKLYIKRTNFIHVVRLLKFSDKDNKDGSNVATNYTLRENATTLWWSQGICDVRDRTFLYGIGNSTIVTIGHFDGIIYVDDIVFKVVFYVVGKLDINYSIMLGNSLLKAFAVEHC